MTTNSESNLNLLESKVKQLEEVNEILQQLLIAFPHETRAPIAMINGFANLLLTEECGTHNEKQKEFVERILAITQRLKHIYGDIQNITNALISRNGPPEKINLKQCLDELADIQIDHMEIDHSLEIWMHQHWLYSALYVLFSFLHDNYILKRTVFCESPIESQHLVLHINHSLSQKYPLSEDDLRLESIRISAEQQGGFFNWEQRSENEVEFQLGLPVIEARPRQR